MTAAPTGVTTPATPAIAKVTWQPVAGATRYRVERSKPGSPNCCRNEATNLTTTTQIDSAGFPLPGEYVYRVTAVQGAGAEGATTASIVRPTPKNPSIWTERFQDQVTLFLDAVASASYYMVWGPGLPSEGR